MVKDDRISKWWNDGCSIIKIAAKLGNKSNTIRVIEGLIREKLITVEQSQNITIQSTRKSLQNAS